MTDDGTVRTETPMPGVVEIVIDRPPLNILSERLQQQLAEGVERVRSDQTVRVVLIRGEGNRAFSAGADVKELARHPSPDPWFGETAKTHWTATLSTLPCVTISCIEGHCLGGGLELALCTDIRIAGPTTTFGFPEIRLGLIPGMGGTTRLPSIVGLGWALEMILTGDSVNAEQALARGLVNRIEESARDAGLDMARMFAEGPQRAQEVAKDLVRYSAATALSEAERTGWLSLWATPERTARLDRFLSGQSGSQ